MSDAEAKIHILDAAYKPFPTFSEWASKTTVDTARWDRYSASLQSKDDSSKEALKRAREVVKRAAALDTGAIEGLYEVDRGFTFTVAFETAAWEVELAKKGENVRPLFEAQLHAYDYVLDLATQAEPISEVAIHVLHEVVCKAQSTYRVMTSVGPQEQELVKGRYKVLPNHVRTRDGVDHSYAPVDVTPAEMQRLVEEMRTAAFLAAHPVTQAAYAHYALVVIHPFADGNGRVARALASAFTYRAISMPIMILSEHKEAYLDSLEVADNGDFQSFVDFMLARALDTVMLVNESISVADSPGVEEGLAAINRLFVTKGGYTQDQVDRASEELFQVIRGDLSEKFARFSAPNIRADATLLVRRGLRISAGPSHRLPTGYEGDAGLLHLELSTSPPAHARVVRNYALLVPVDAASNDEVRLVRVVDGAKLVRNQAGGVMTAETAFSARLEELIPSPSGVLRIRASIRAERLVGEMLAELTSLADRSLRGQG